jgi:hypothetical protein
MTPIERAREGRELGAIGRRWRWSAPMKLVAIVALAGAISVMGFEPAAAAAINEGPCKYFLNGAPSTQFDTQDHALTVASDQQVTVSGTVPGKFKQYDVWLQFGFGQIDAGKGTPNGPTFSQTVNVKDYAKFGSGIYKILSEATVESSGGTSCVADAYVLVTGSLLSTAAGIGAAVAGGLGLAGVVGGAASSAAENRGTTKEWEAQQEADRKEEASTRKERREILGPGADLFPELGCIGCAVPMSLFGLLAILVGGLLGIKARRGRMH